MENADNAKFFWKLALNLSAISHYPAKPLLPFWPDVESQCEHIRLLELCSTPSVPSVVLHALLHTPISVLHQIVSKYGEQLFQWHYKVHSGLNIFIDKLDHAVRPLGNRALWISMQEGLLEGAWEVMRGNPHLKIYTSMRQEAYANYNSANKAAISGEVSFIEYTPADLANLLNRLVQAYENKESYSKMLGFENVTNNGHQNEKVFSYTYRHTIGRPRDFVSICSKLSPQVQDTNIDPSMFRKIVNSTAERDVISPLFEEEELFLHILGNREQRREFLSRLPANILTLAEMKHICRAFNRRNTSCHLNCKECAKEGFVHPFCDLYNIGLLGVVARNEVDGEDRQEFLEPYRMAEYSWGVLPSNNPYYFVHPSLTGLIKEARNLTYSLDYRVIPDVTVGQGYKLTPDSLNAIEINRKFLKVSEIGGADA